jgi:hypothetical protein
MNAGGFSLNLALPDLWQQEAVRALRGGSDVVVDAPTGAGKTWIFELLVKGGWKGQAVFTVPTRALANDKRLEWQRQGWNAGIVTGDVSENAGAPVVVATLETQRERLLRGDGPTLLVIDEYQMLGDPVRGACYELAVALAPATTRLLLLSGSVGNAREVVEWMRRLGRRVELVSVRDRPVPLEEMPVEQLPRQVPKQITGFWPRLAAGVLLSGLGPLLVFAPRRKDAEAIARRIAVSVPTPDPLVLTKEQERILGADYAALLRQRVACHHSGMSYQQRAGIIEPLAKAGQLRVIAATTGLAAGINFSMRSVIVAETVYFDGRRERQIAPDELLQMFGRAGRRGLDETGYVISAARTPRLSDASQRALRRSNQIDWPVLLRVMERAAARGEAAFPAAAAFCEQLFSRQKIVLGFEKAVPGAVVPVGGAPTNLFGLQPTRREVRNAAGEWETMRKERVGTAALGTALVWREGKAVRATGDLEFMTTTFRIGRVCRLASADGGVTYGREMAVAVARETGMFSLTKPAARMIGERAGGEWSEAEIGEKVVVRLAGQLEGGVAAGLVRRGEVLALLIDYGALEWPVYADASGARLVGPEERVVTEERDAEFAGAGGMTTAASHTAVYAWRKLGLVTEDGTPTRRGRVFSLFSGGEGLAVAAALEDGTYVVEELVRDLANVRGGHRFGETGSGGASERLALVCLQTYGAANYEGYLDAGLPTGYGEGTAEALGCWLEGRAVVSQGDGVVVGNGDMERAFTEWVSLLRQIVHGPDAGWDRWRALQEACRKELAVRERLLPSRELPVVPAIQLGHVPRHQQVAL